MRSHSGPPAAVIALTAALMLFAAACTGRPASGSDPSPDAPGSTGSASAVAYSACMRSHGVPKFPDPDKAGNLPKGTAENYGVGESAYKSAQSACVRLLPTASAFRQQVQQCYLAGNCPPALVQQMMTVGQKFARCMRTHGVPNWPDPIRDHDGRPYFDVSHHGFTRSQLHSGPMETKFGQCGRIAGGSLATG